MINIAKQARRILAGTRRGTNGEKVFPGYISFEAGQRPVWWADHLAPDAWGRVLGVHEHDPESPIDAIVVAERGIGIYKEHAEVVWLPYDDIAGWERLSKEPISHTLVVQRKSGASVELKFHCGEAFAFVQFLINALNAVREGTTEP